jgi:hypothetical protein
MSDQNTATGTVSRAMRLSRRLLLQLPLMGVAAAALSGCEQETGTTGQDSDYLAAPLKSEDPVSERTDMLPLKTGNWWEMTAVCAGERSNDRHVVVGQVTAEDITGIQVDHYRNGKKWRREIFQKKGDTLYVAGMQDETSELMRYHPPIPLYKEPVSEGDYLPWYGEFRLGKRSFPARALTRISGKEAISTAAGRFKAFRVDTIVVVSNRSNETRFPTVRWLAAHVGFVRRGFADKGRPGFSEVMKFNVQ